MAASYSSPTDHLFICSSVHLYICSSVQLLICTFVHVHCRHMNWSLADRLKAQRPIDNNNNRCIPIPRGWQDLSRIIVSVLQNLAPEHMTRKLGVCMFTMYCTSSFVEVGIMNTDTSQIVAGALLIFSSQVPTTLSTPAAFTMSITLSTPLLSITLTTCLHPDPTHHPPRILNNGRSHSLTLQSALQTYRLHCSNDIATFRDARDRMLILAFTR